MITSRRLLIPHNPSATAKILTLMTPNRILRADILPEGQKILPDAVQCFNDILLRRLEVRDLRFLPVKADADRKAFRELDPNALHAAMQHELGGANIGVAANDYPYFLPPDLEQLLIWVRRRETSHLEIAKFLSRLMQKFNVDPGHIVLFERPYKSKQLLIKGTFPLMRHIHLWLPR